VAEFEARDALRGRRVGWTGAGGVDGEGSGVADGIDERGNLLVLTADGQRLSLGSGEVTLTVDRSTRE
jgi:biotin-(acetyl-CoA carboxylase) ligase